MDKVINVVFLDDEVNILSSLKRTFINESFDVFTTTDAKEALEVIQKEQVKVVLSDQRMPNISGVDFLKQVLELKPEVVRILFTGYADVQAAEDAINKAKVYRFLNKPWNVNDLKSAVERAMQHYDLVVQNKQLFEDMKTTNEELELINRKLKNMYEVQKEFTSTVSHELRTPLASIKSTVDLVLSQTPGKLNEDQVKFLLKSKNNVDRLNRLINDILDLTKMETGKIDFNIQFGDLGKIIREDIEIQQNVAADKKLFLKAEIPDDLPNIPIDADKMHQVFNNLIGNALKFTDQGGITVSCKNHAENNYIEVCVQDTGQGIKEEDMDKLFGKFQQLGDSRKHVGGTGLGLAICKEIIQRHGGKIWVKSEFGKGTGFYFDLPLQERRKEQP